MKIFGKFKKKKVKTPEEQAEIQFKKIKFKKTDISIDCGANVGSYTKRLSKNKAIVYAFEPNPYVYGILYDKFKENPNVHCINKGVMDEQGVMKLFLRKNSSENPVKFSIGSSFMTLSKYLNYESNLEIEVVDLCKFIESLNSRVKVLKIDIEGAEMKILKKLIKTGMISKIDYVFVEMHDNWSPELKPEADEIRDLIKTKGIKNINLDWK
ncbi:MAG: FkbM family methyltransferase [Melioribacteraceae bacterium]|nr:FkbM family methyltransferase [Melioribacteraceae bacterium]